VRDHLNSRAEIVTPPLAREDVLIDASGSDVVVTRGGTTGEPFVVTEVKVGLGSVIGDEDLAVLIWRHRSGIDVDIRIELAQAHLVSTCLQQRPERCGSETLTE
jgi:hypothetical protein